MLIELQSSQDPILMEINWLQLPVQVIAGAKLCTLQMLHFDHNINKYGNLFSI